MKKIKKVAGGILTYKTADILSTIASALLVLFGLFAAILKNDIYEDIKNIPGITESLLLTYGIIWIILGLIIFIVNSSVKKTGSKAMKWLLLVLGFAALTSGRLEGILAMAAALIYIIRKNEKPK